MKRLMLLWLCVLLGLGLWSAGRCAYAQAPTAPLPGRALTPLPNISPEILRASLDRSLLRLQLNAQERQHLLQNLQKLPLPAQTAALAMMDASTAETMGQPDLYNFRLQTQLSEILRALPPETLIELIAPRLNILYPQGGGTPNAWAFAIGQNFPSDSVVQINNVNPPENHVLTSKCIMFRVPTGFSYGTNVNCRVYSARLNRSSNALSWRIVAPRGYRGVHGLQFPNFSAATIPWAVYRFVFGAANVEFPDGTHRPSAQAWYDSTFKGCGAGGNCFGMSQLSLRLREYTHCSNLTALDRVMHNAWIKDNVSWGAWTLPWGTNSKEAVQSLQGIQLVEPMLTHIRNQRNSQDNKSAWEYANNMINNQRRPVQNSTYGHAVVCFNTEIDGNNRKFCFYDNNHPYSETETCGSDPDHGVTNWSTGTFSYGSYTRIASYDPHQLTGQPQLPPGVGPDTGAEGATGTQARFEVPRVPGLIIRDEAGRGGPDGNGIPGLFEVEVDMGLGPTPPSFPRIFILLQPANRALTFQIPGGALRQIACYTRGSVLLMSASGATIQATFSQLAGPNAQLTLPNPAASGLQNIQIIAPIGAAEERQFVADNFTGLGATPLGVSLNTQRSALELLNAPGAQPINFRLQLRRFAPGGTQTRPPIQQSLATGQLLRIGPQNWGALSGQLRLEQLALPTGRLPR